mmetsp:Transcript_12627/g.18958  ORF Transcript_12627/g.18958 Transcript_12627/m.18958 type:complete len:440 (-) Transcript_12627:411-1730(-)|eukprot:CAMPEP_0196814578 /NCGR_PEP_ID=MMETSP1362-20130617/44309_1 /TAXON_ID=163516 /ORGANISM="Leptocylindrus danicus, Strain CCMP1856" /LENGTH=439 /DNA_ID=CAMNT_0042191235 /DNA_START=98 /DNA_END=1417 /DNA_ORIENTATION=+
MEERRKSTHDDNNSSTYEHHAALKRASSSTKHHPDKVVWDPDFTFRNQPYRLLGHQKNNVMGRLSVRLLEGQNLKRPRDDWSLMALGPVKHLGLSHKHGEVRSSYVAFQLTRCYSSNTNDGSNDNNNNNSMMYYSEEYGEEFKSSVISNSNGSSPVWTDRAGSCFSIPLKKGSLPDGVPVCLLAKVFEPHTAVEAMLPSQIKGGSQPLGQAILDVTDLCLGAESVKDVWIDLNPPDLNLRAAAAAAGTAKNSSSSSSSLDLKNGDSSESSSSSGKLRLLISYEPCGLEPSKNDTVCLEAFARSPTSLIVPSLNPMRVVDRSGGYLLLQYKMRGGRSNRYGTIRLHRNAVFVIERFSVVDGAVDVVLKPTDMIIGSPLGQSVAEAIGPVVSTAGDFLKPVLLTGQLATTMGIGGISTMAKIVLASTGGNKRDGDFSHLST